MSVPWAGCSTSVSEEQAQQVTHVLVLAASTPAEQRALRLHPLRGSLHDGHLFMQPPEEKPREQQRVMVQRWSVGQLAFLTPTEGGSIVSRYTSLALHLSREVRRAMGAASAHGSKTLRPRCVPRNCVAPSMGSLTPALVRCVHATEQQSIWHLPSQNLAGRTVAKRQHFQHFNSPEWPRSSWRGS